MTIQAKICGINSRAAMTTAVEYGADHVGLVFYPPSPRSVTALEAAELITDIPQHIVKVGLFVNMADDNLTDIISTVSLDLLQLHGSESPKRVAGIKRSTGISVMKAIPILDEDDLLAANSYLETADQLLFDAKVPPNIKGALPGGNALSFDWTLLTKRTWSLPWMLSGGLNSQNVADAVCTSGANSVDVSSGVESAPGKKDPAQIRAFLSAVKSI